MSDVSSDPRIEGLWRVEFELADGREEFAEPWHYLFQKGVQTEIVPEIVDMENVRTTYVTDVSKTPCRMVLTTDSFDSSDGPKRITVVEYAVYAISGDRLRITYCDEDYLDALTDSFPFTIKTLVRDPGPIPIGKKPSGVLPITHEVLGQLTWDDNAQSYFQRIHVGELVFGLSLVPGSENEPENVIERAVAVVGQIKQYIRVTQQCAVKGLLNIKNDTWREGGDDLVSRADFIKALVLDSVAIYENGNVNFWFDDGGLFSDHAIRVSLDSCDNCTSTDIPG